MSATFGHGDQAGLVVLMADPRRGLIGEVDRRFRCVLLRAGLPMLLFAVAVPWLQFEPPLPVMKRLPSEPRRVELLPAPVLRTQRPSVVTPPRPAAAKVAAAVHQPVAADAVREARQQAAAAGLMQMREQLAAIGDRRVVAVTRPSALITAVRDGRGITPGAGLGAAGSSAVGGSAPRPVAGQGVAADLGAHRTGQVQGGLLAGSGTGRAAGLGAGGQGERSLEEIQLGFDRNKSSLNAIFSRASRDAVGMRAGRIVLSLTIAPDGSVSRCELLSSSFANAALEQKLLARIRQMNFGPRAVPPFTVLTYPLDYLPS